MELPELPKKRRFRYKMPKPDPANANSGALYCRASRGHQELSIPAQLRVMRAELTSQNLTLIPDYYNGPADNVANNPNPVPGVFADQAVSAFTTNLADRPAGRRMLQSLKPGQFVMCARLDRMFRSMADFCIVSDWLLEQQVRLIVCSPRIDLGTATGRLLARNLASLAQWESERRSERIREANAQKRLRDGLEPQPKERQPKSINLGSDYRPPEKPIHVEQKPGRIFIYLRVSHRESVASGLGLMDQIERAKAYANSMVAINPRLAIVEVFIDPAQSAWKTNLADRPAGKAMCEVLAEGDHVVFATLDRGFRSVRDLSNTIPDWLAKGVTAHFAAEGINMSDPGGRMLANAIVQFAEFEAQLASDRNKEARAVMAASGQYVGGREPVFWNLRRFGRHTQLTLNRDRIVEFRLLRLLRLHKKLPLNEALERVEALIAARDGRIPIPASGIHPQSKLSAQLPESYKRDARGVAFPTWSRKRYYEGLKLFDDAISKWRLVAAERRRLRD